MTADIKIAVQELSRAKGRSTRPRFALVLSERGIIWLTIILPALIGFWWAVALLLTPLLPSG